MTTTTPDDTHSHDDPMISHDRDHRGMLIAIMLEWLIAIVGIRKLALEAGVATKTHILNILHRLVDGKTASVTPIDAPQALVLRHEPQADVGRYDTLMKEVRHAS